MNLVFLLIIILQGGFFHTGDIGEIDTEGKLHIIDRKKNLIELYVKGRSVWVSAGAIENFFLSGLSDKIRHIFLHGERTQSCCIAVVVLQPHYFNSSSLNTSTLHSLQQVLLEDMKKVGEEAGLDDYAIPQGVVIENDPTFEWTVQRGLLTATNKLCRGRLLLHYKLAIDLAYTQLGGN